MRILTGYRDPAILTGSRCSDGMYYNIYVSRAIRSPCRQPLHERGTVDYVRWHTGNALEQEVHTTSSTFLTYMAANPETERAKADGREDAVLFLAFMTVA